MICQERNKDQTKSDDSEWVFELLDRIFKESHSSADENKESGINSTDPEKNEDNDPEKVSDLHEKIIEENNSSAEEVKK